MSENFYTYPECGYGEQLVSYLYEEIEPRERRDFEEHLRSCLTCPPEVAAFQEMRFSFENWRETEAIQTPRFAVNQAVSQETEIGTHWLDWLRSFVFSPARSFAAVAILIAVAAGMYFFISNRQLNQEISHNTPLTIENKTESGIADIHPDFDTGKQNRSVLNPSTVPTPAKSDNHASNSGTAIKVSPRISKPANKVRSEMKLSNAQFAKNERPANGKKVPRIPAVDEEDRSLRLADIFDEVSMK